MSTGKVNLVMANCLNNKILCITAHVVRVLSLRSSVTYGFVTEP